MCVTVSFLSLNNREPTPKYQYTHKYTHEYIRYWRDKIECEISRYDDENIPKCVISRTEPDSTEIETIILEFLK
jgi:hypothetical protein